MGNRVTEQNAAGTLQSSTVSIPYSSLPPLHNPQRMIPRCVVRSLSVQGRWFSSSVTRHHKVAVLGAGGGIGQPLSLLLKADPLVTSLSLYDIRGAPGVAADVSHIDTPGEVSNPLRFAQLLLNDVVPGQRLPRRQTRGGS